METTTRAATLDDLARLLIEQQARKVDVIATATQISAEGGMIRLAGSDPILTAEGVDMADGLYRPTDVFDAGIASKLDIPRGYVQRMRSERPDLWDANVNGWLHGDGVDPDPRSFMLRLFAADGVGVARAFLSDKYARIDHLDALTAALDGVKQAGVPIDVESCDLTDRRMYVRVWSDAVKVLAPDLLKGYRSPWLDGGRAAARHEGLGYDEGDEPVVFAGFQISNSETGGGAFTITPRLRVQVCANGLVINTDVMRAVHLGGKQEEGVIRWGFDTNEKALALITARSRDAVATFLDVDYMRTVIRRLEAKAGKPVTDAQDTVQSVTKRLGFSEEHRKGVLDFFIAGGQLTAGGVMQAVTAFAQTVDDADEAARIESAGIDALELV